MRQVDERAGERDTLLLAAGELVGRRFTRRRGRPARARPRPLLDLGLSTFLRWRPKATFSATSGAGTARSSGRRCWSAACGPAGRRRLRRRSGPRPAVGCSKPAIIRRVVVLPQPDGPSRVKNSPLTISRSMSRTATKSSNCLTTPDRRTPGSLTRTTPRSNPCSPRTSSIQAKSGVHSFTSGESPKYVQSGCYTELANRRSWEFDPSLGLSSPWRAGRVVRNVETRWTGSRTRDFPKKRRRVDGSTETIQPAEGDAGHRSAGDERKRHLWMHFTRMGSFADHDVPIIVRGEGAVRLGRPRQPLPRRALGAVLRQRRTRARRDRRRDGDQVPELDFITNWSYAHPRAIELAERIASLAPGDLNRIFFTNGGSEAVESAISSPAPSTSGPGTAERTSSEP